MRVIIDIVHPVDINFYKNAIEVLIKKNIDVELTVRPRGRLISILEKELHNVPFKIIGKHYSTVYGKMFGLVKRDLELAFYLSKVDFDIGTSFGFYICHASRILGKPSVAFEDDYEYKLPFYLAKFTATRHVMPDCIPATGKNIYKYKGFKELAYLHPNYFKPNKDVLREYELRPNEYVFIREISSTSLNYQEYLPNLFEITKYLRERGFDIIISLEDKSVEERFKEECIILKEPVEDIHSLLSFAALTISSGDTMARESCLVGTPAIYTGKKEMYVNRELIKKGCMFKVDDIRDISRVVEHIIKNNLKRDVKEVIDYGIKHEWDDTTKVILKHLKEVVNE